MSENGNILKFITKDVLKDFDIKPMYKWIIGFVFTLGIIYAGIKELPTIKADIKDLQLDNREIKTWIVGNDKRMDRFEGKIDRLLQRK